jgi:hypothetical protein
MASGSGTKDHKCPECGTVMVQQFDDKLGPHGTILAVPNGTFKCRKCGYQFGVATEMIHPEGGSREGLGQISDKGDSRNLADELVDVANSIAAVARSDAPQGGEEMPRPGPIIGIHTSGNVARRAEVAPGVPAAEQWMASNPGKLPGPLTDSDRTQLAECLTAYASSVHAQLQETNEVLADGLKDTQYMLDQSKKRVGELEATNERLTQSLRQIERRTRPNGDMENQGVNAVVWAVLPPASAEDKP